MILIFLWKLSFKFLSVGMTGRSVSLFVEDKLPDRMMHLRFMPTKKRKYDFSHLFGEKHALRW
jgi:hypothetical protein